MSEERLLGGRYEVGPILGRGGMATVRQAHDRSLNRDVAVKELRIDLASDATFQERFRREARAAGSLNHPNIVAVYDTGEETDPATGVGVPYIVMELIQGKTLRDILRDGRPILPRRALEFTLGILDALAYSHAAGIVHRDIKPANVMITTAGNIKVMDFGIARAVADTSSTMTQTAAVIGTAQYLSPEQARGETVDFRSDLYSAGCLMYELLVGRPPFTGDSPVSVAYQHVREAPVPPSALDSEVTPGMDAVVLKALAKAPQDRYQTAAMMSADIRRLLAGQPVHATPAPPPVAALPTQGASSASAPTSLVYGSQGRHVATADTGRLTTVTTPLPPQRRRGGWLWAVITGLLVVAVIAGTVFLGLTRKTQVAVPSVKGLDQAGAVALIQERNLNPKITQVQGPDDTTLNKVTDQQPATGTLVDPGSNVTITVNIGPTKMELPRGIVGNDVKVVEAQLTQAGFKVNSVKADSEPATAKANQVLRVDPVEGSKVAAGQEITLYYATGQAQVPNLRTLKCAAAVEQARSAGFLTTTTSERATPTENDAGTVADTLPLPYVVANKADTLTIYCYVYAPPPTTPPVTTPPTTTTTTTPSTTPSPTPSKTP